MGIKAEICHQLGRIPGIDRIIPGARTTIPPVGVKREVYRVPRPKNNHAHRLPENGGIKMEGGHYTLRFNDDGVMVRDYGPERDTEPAIVLSTPRGETCY